VTLEELIREAASGKNGLTHLSIIPTAKGWSATYSPSRQCAHNTVLHADPVEALKLAITGWRAVRNVTPKETPNEVRDTDDSGGTAGV